MSDIPAQTNRLATTLASPATAAVLVGTNLLLPYSYAMVGREAAPSVYEQLIDYPFAVSTSTIAEQVSGEAREATRPVVQAGIKWNSYVSRRLAALRVGADDFTGLKVPSPWIVDRAWDVASSYFRRTTPPPSVVPTEDGDILYLWRKAGWELHVEIGSEGTTAWAYHRQSGETWSGSLGERRLEFYNLLDLLGQS